MDISKPKYAKTDFLKYTFLDYLPVIEKNELDRVYRPNDDSYLMLDVLNLEANNSIPNGSSILEIGSGSGILINHLASFLDRENKPASYAIAVDVNFDACTLTKKYGEYYKINQLECINTNIISGLSKIKEKIDVVICNPPYVPTDEEELENALSKLKEKDRLLKEGKMEEMKKINCVDASYAGGTDGMTITQNMIDSGIELLALGGSLYLFLIFENNLESIVKGISSKFNKKEFKFELLATQRKYNELQYVLKCKRVN